MGTNLGVPKIQGTSILSPKTARCTTRHRLCPADLNSDATHLTLCAHWPSLRRGRGPGRRGRRRLSVKSARLKVVWVVLCCYTNQLRWGLVRHNSRCPTHDCNPSATVRSPYNMECRQKGRKIGWSQCHTSVKERNVIPPPDTGTDWISALECHTLQYASKKREISHLPIDTVTVGQTKKYDNPA